MQKTTKIMTTTIPNNRKNPRFSFFRSGVFFFTAKGSCPFRLFFFLLSRLFLTPEFEVIYFLSRTEPFFSITYIMPHKKKIFTIKKHRTESISVRHPNPFYTIQIIFFCVRYTIRRELPLPQLRYLQRAEYWNAANLSHLLRYLKQMLLYHFLKSAQAQFLLYLWMILLSLHRILMKPL